jgi:tripartite-type tricarboxylate transporter receptor subunit TctC
MGPAFTDLLGGRIGLLIAAPATVMTAIKAGRVKALAIGTPGGRIPALPDVPTLRELGYDFTYSFWYGLLGPKGVPQPIVARMQAEVTKAFADPAFRARFVDQGGVPVAGDGAALSKVMQTDLTVWGGMIRDRGIKPD